MIGYIKFEIAKHVSIRGMLLFFFFIYLIKSICSPQDKQSTMHIIPLKTCKPIKTGAIIRSNQYVELLHIRTQRAINSHSTVKTLGKQRYSFRRINGLCDLHLPANCPIREGKRNKVGGGGGRRRT